MSVTPEIVTGKFFYKILFYSLCTLFIIRFYFIFHTDINWDEFFYLSNIYEHQRHELKNSFQTLHVHAFGWLKYTSTNEIWQIISARIIMYILSLITAYFIYAICRKFTSPIASLFALVSYCMFTFVMDHAASFRTDPIVTCFLMGSIYLIILHKRHYLSFLLAGLLIGISGMVTIKSVFYIPTIATILLAYWLCEDDKKTMFLKGALAGGAAILTFSGLYILHSNGLQSDVIQQDPAMISSSIEKTILSSGIFPQWNILIHAILANSIIMITLFLGSFIALRMAFTRHNSFKKRKIEIIILSFLLPLVSVVFYRNTFPYFYPFILAPTAVLLALFADHFLTFQSKSQQYNRIAIICLAFMMIQSGVGIWKNLQRSNQTQVTTLEVIHKLFPNPVAYIDRNSMVSSFPKKGFFMSSWGIEVYNANAKPIMRDILNSDQPKFIIANIRDLDFELKYNNSRLLPKDEAILRDNFIHHWGKIYLPGKTIQNLDVNPNQDFEILIEGNYLIEGKNSIMLDGKMAFSGDNIFLKKGYHTLKATKPSDTIVLRWADNLYKPNMPPPNRPIFYGF